MLILSVLLSQQYRILDDEKESQNMANIRIDTDGLASGSKTLEMRLADYRGCLSQLDSIIAQISETWEGQASVAYITKITVQKNQFERMIEVLEEFIKYTNKANYEFSSLDESAAERIRASF